MSDSDQLRKFLFEHSPVRGYLVRLDATWRAANEHHGYQPVVRDALGEVLDVVHRWMPSTSHVLPYLMQQTWRR